MRFPCAGFNPLSSMFSFLAARNEEQFYNTSTGSPEITSQGFPAAFFPRELNRKQTFVVVFPVCAASAPPPASRILLFVCVLWRSCVLFVPVYPDSFLHAAEHMLSRSQKLDGTCKNCDKNGSAWHTTPRALQAAVDAHTVARIWRFLIDAHFITDSSKELTLSVPVLNRSAQIFSFWKLKISMSQSGRITGRASITNAPMYSSGIGWSVFDVLSVASDVFLLLFTLLHTLFVSGLLAPSVDLFMRHLKPQNKDARSDAAAVLSTPEQSDLPSCWFQLLCQFSCVALTVSVIVGMWLTSSTLRCALSCLPLSLVLMKPRTVRVPVFMSGYLTCVYARLLASFRCMHLSSRRLNM